MSILFGGQTEWSKEFMSALRQENVSQDRLLSKLRNNPKPVSRVPAARTELHNEYPPLEVKLDPFLVRGIKKPIKVSFIFYADKYTWGDYKG